LASPLLLFVAEDTDGKRGNNVAIGQYKELLRSKGFQSFLWTESLGALNDNLYKIVVTLAALAASQGTDTRYLSLAQAAFILPFLFFSGYAGYFADKYSKRSVLVATKAFEIVAMGLALAVFIFPRIELMLGVLFLMALQSTFFGPAKYGILPEMLPDRDLSRANGLLNMTTFLAIILGTAAGGLLYSAWGGRPWVIGLVLIAVAAAGLLASLGIPRVKEPGSPQGFDWNPWAEVTQGVRRLRGDRRLWLTAMGICYFWFLGALLQITILVFGKQMLGADELRLSILVTCLAVGIGAGSLAAGRLSGDKVELGLVPLGAVGMGVFAVLLAWSAPSYSLAAAAMTLLGFSGGLFVIPLNAFLQQRSGGDERGRIFAATNFLTMTAVLLAAFLSWLLLDVVHTPVDRILWMAGLFTLLATIYVLEVLPEFLIRFLFWMLTHTVYRIRITGQQHVPFRGPALLVCNHLSTVDGFLVAACVQRFIRFMVYAPYYEHRLLNGVFRRMNAIPVSEGNRKQVVQSIERAREELRQGHVVCIFPEGSISRTGNLLPFKRGMERIARDLDIPVIPVHLDGVWGSIFSFEGGRFFKKLPRRWPYPVTVSFGAPLPSSATAQEARQAVMELGAAVVEHRRKPDDVLHWRFIRTAKRQPFYFCMADSSGRRLTYSKALAGSLVLSRWIGSRCRGQSMVGLLLPSSVGGALANIAVSMTGKVPVNLNFTAGREAMEAAVGQCGIRTILTSRIFVKKAQLPTLDGMVFLEDILKRISPANKAGSFLAALLLPSRLLRRLYCARNADSSSLATVIFSSGSTGIPKGVMLSHHNVISNIEAIAQIFAVHPADTVMGVLPFFHSFGFTGTLWFPLLSGFAAAYHPNPLDAKTVGEMVSKHRATMLIATPTFCGAYLRKCSPEEFASLRLALCGAEKLRAPLADAFQEKYGLPLVEGYGATETAPVISANCPDFIAPGYRQSGSKPGSVGQPLPGVAVKVVDLESGATLPMGEEGLLLVKGPNVMQGYLGQPEKTAEVLRDGWYTTGDIGRIDEEGFLHITDRLSRFSKIGGEMVPHIRVEQMCAQILTSGTCAVTAVPDERKGEQLVLFYTSPAISAEELWRNLSAADLPKLWIPKRESLFLIDEIPILGTGKTDLKKLRAMALERLSAPRVVETVSI